MDGIGIRRVLPDNIYTSEIVILIICCSLLSLDVIVSKCKFIRSTVYLSVLGILLICVKLFEIHNIHYSVDTHYKTYLNTTPVSKVNNGSQETYRDIYYILVDSYTSSLA